MSFPPEVPPDLPREQCADGELAIRYEDIAQDGRIQVTALPHALGALVWSRLLREHPITALARAEGILPILTKLVLTGSNEPLPVTRPLCGRGAFELAHAGEGESRRLILHIWIELHGERGRTYGPPPAGAGERVPVGTVYGEHVFTRPFAPTGQRRVTRFDATGLPAVPPREHDYLAPGALLELPDGATPIDGELDGELVTDETPVVFGLTHTDSNQHVNSLVYPRLFEEAILRRLAAIGQNASGVLLRRVELGYRRPCFSGERVRLRLRLFGRGGVIGAVGMFEDDEESNGKPRCYLRAELA